MPANERSLHLFDPTDLEWIYLAPDYLSITVIVDSASHLAAKVVSDAN